MRATSGWRTTSRALKKVKLTPSTPRSTSKRITQSRALVARQIDLGEIARDHGDRAEADAGEEHFHLLDRGVLRLVEDDEGFIERAAAHVGEGCDLDDVALHEFGHAIEAEHLVEGVVKRPEVGIDLLREIAGQEAQLLAGLHRRAHQDQARDAMLLERLNRAGHGEVGLSRARRADAEVDVVCGDALEIEPLIGAAGPHDPAAHPHRGFSRRLFG